MYRRLIQTVAAAGLVMGVAATSAAAFSPATTALDTPESLVQKTHGCHRSCEWGPVNRWHRHIGARCIPVGCIPRAAYPNRCWVDWRGVRHCRW